MNREDLVGKVVRYHNPGSTRAQLYLICDDIRLPHGKINVDTVLRWIELGYELSFYEEAK
jgi:hypothetical protein